MLVSYQDISTKNTFMRVVGCLMGQDWKKLLWLQFHNVWRSTLFIIEDLLNFIPPIKLKLINRYGSETLIL
jgi:hypothetical protein